MLAEEYAGRVVVAKLDVDANPQTAALFAVMTVPTLLLFHRGQAQERINGYRPIQVFRDELEKLLAGVWS